MCVSEIFEEYIDCICLRARMIMAFGAIMTIIPLRQLLKKDPKQGADGTHVLRAFNWFIKKENITRTIILRSTPR